MKGKFFLLFIVLSVICVYCTGCGETVRGISKDAHRVEKGIRSIFVAE